MLLPFQTACVHHFVCKLPSDGVCPNLCEHYIMVEKFNSTLTPTNTQMLSASQINHSLKNMESDEKRLQFLADSFDGMCLHCGKVTRVCYCMRDD